MGRGRALTSHKNSEGIYCRIGKQLILTIFFLFTTLFLMFLLCLSPYFVTSLFALSGCSVSLCCRNEVKILIALKFPSISSRSRQSSQNTYKGTCWSVRTTIVAVGKQLVLHNMIVHL